MRTLVVSLLFLAVGELHADDLAVLKNGDTDLLDRYLKRKAHTALTRRKQAYERLKTTEQVWSYQKRMRRFFIDQLGGFPERTPLHAKVVGRMQGDGCRIEKIIFESQPKHFVTANLYLPRSKPPYPAVLVPCGHTANGKTGYQKICILLAQHGIAAFCYDPIGQGERYQLLDEAGKPQHRSTTEHTLLGVGSILVGRNTATYRIWDGIRALDYLVSRRDIDGAKLGCTGISGGGTLTEYLMALDERIVAAAPGCAPMTWAARIDTIGPGDAEQNIFGQIAFGMDHGDYAMMRAPRPTLLLTATRDFVDIGGAWDLYREGKRIYARIGFHERVSLVEADERHGYTRPLRISATRWMRRWLLQIDDAVSEGKLATRTHRELSCTPHGQVQLVDGARSVMDLNMEVAERFKAARKRLWMDKKDSAFEQVRKLTGIRRLQKLPKPDVRIMGQLKRKAYTAKKLVLEPKEGIVLPALLLEPTKPNGRCVLYVDGLGKPTEIHANDRVGCLLAAGCVVLAVDLRGMGETGAKASKQWGGSFDHFFMSYLLGKSLLGMRAEDLLISARYLAERRACKSIELLAVGVAGPIALHAAALEPQLFSRVELHRCSTTWLDVVENPNLPGRLVNAVHGALRVYDLSDLWQSLPKEKTRNVSQKESSQR